MNAIDGNAATGWGGSPYHDGVLPFLALRLAEPVSTSADTQIVIRLRHDTAFRKATTGRVRIALSPELAAPVMDGTNKKHEQVDKGLSGAILDALKKPADKRSDDDKTLIGKVLDWTDARHTDLVAARGRAQAKLEAFELTDVDMIAVALATIRAETEGFVPISEMISQYNTLPGKPPFKSL